MSTLLDFHLIHFSTKKKHRLRNHMPQNINKSKNETQFCQEETKVCRKSLQQKYYQKLLRISF